MKRANIVIHKVPIKDHPGWFRKRFRCECGYLLKSESWDETRCFGMGSCLSDNTMPHYCPQCGLSVYMEEISQEPT